MIRSRNFEHLYFLPRKQIRWKQTRHKRKGICTFSFVYGLFFAFLKINSYNLATMIFRSWCVFWWGIHFRWTVNIASCGHFLLFCCISFVNCFTLMLKCLWLGHAFVIMNYLRPKIPFNQEFNREILWNYLTLLCRGKTKWRVLSPALQPRM